MPMASYRFINLIAIIGLCFFVLSWKAARQLGIDPKIIKRTVVALYEAEVNVVAHAWRGVAEIEITPDRISMILTDEGPGIADIPLAMQEGYSTASPEVREMGFGAGMGLSILKARLARARPSR